MADDLLIISNGCVIAPTNTKVSGHKKLCQRFLLELFTEKGSMLYLPNRGCYFLTRLFDKATTEFDVLAAFVASRADIRRNLRSDESLTTPENERYYSSALDEITLTGRGLSLTFLVKNKAGNVMSISAPELIL